MKNVSLLLNAKQFSCPVRAYSRFFASSVLVGLLVVSFAIGCAEKPTVFPPPASGPITFSPDLKTTRTELSNGTVVMVREDHELPFVSGTLTIRGGTFVERAPGTVGAMADQMRNGGAGKLSTEQLDEELHNLAAGISSTAGQESVAISFNCLASDIERVFELFRDVVMHPQFDARRLELWRVQALDSIKRRKDDPRTVASVTFQQLVYGPTAFGRVLNGKNIHALTREALLQEHQSLLSRAGLTQGTNSAAESSNESMGTTSFLTVSGAISSQQVNSLVQRYFQLPVAPIQSEGPAPFKGDPFIPKLSYQPKPGIYFVEQPISQASVFMGQQGPGRLSPDYAAIDVFNELFGSGGFGTRLMSSVRTRLGLVYGISGVVAPGPEKGRTIIGFQTKSESVVSAIAASIEELRTLQQKLPTTQEVAERHDSIGNSFVFRFDSSDEMAQRATALEFLGYPADYDATYIERVHSVTPQLVQDVARTRWNPQEWVIVVVGNKSLWKQLPLLRRVPGLEMMPVKRVTFDEIALVH